MQGSEQKLTIADQCSNVGSITHLIIHTLGLWHEQSRPDRDDYIEILWDNIYPGMIYSHKTLEDLHIVKLKQSVFVSS